MDPPTDESVAMAKRLIPCNHERNDICYGPDSPVFELQNKLCSRHEKLAYALDEERGVSHD